MQRTLGSPTRGARPTIDGARGSAPGPGLPLGEAAPLLAVQDLRVEFATRVGSVTAVNGVSLDLRPGEILGLAGESGSGKSTLAGAILRILRAPAVITGGEVRFGARDVLAMNRDELRAFRWREVAMVFQSAMDSLSPVLTVGEQLVDTILAHEKTSRREAKSRAEALLSSVRLDTRSMRSYPHELSGGMRQRVVIAIAIALNPRVLIMDEPTTALDVIVERQILEEILSLQQQLGFSVLFISHDLPLMLDFADRVGVMYAGELVEIGPSSSLQAGPLHPYTAGLLSAFPSLSSETARRFEIPGAPPSLASPPDGCRFHPRCPQAVAQCSTLAPRARLAQAGRRVACHAPLEDLGVEEGAR